MSRGEPEVGSVIEARTAVREGFRLGQVERKCLQCGREWVDPRCECGSYEFSERDVRPSAMTLTGRGIAEVVEPPKPRVAATTEDVFALRSLRTALVDVENRLLNADQRLHALVNVNTTNYQTFGFLQSVLHQFTEQGDYELRIIDPLRMSTLVPVIRGLVAEIDRTLANFEKERSKK